MAFGQILSSEPVGRETNTSVTGAGVWAKRYPEVAPEGPMTKHDIDTFGGILKDKLADASRTLQSRESIMIEKSADQLDEIERAVARDIAIQYLDRESRLLRDVRSALGRIDACTFGTCLHCEEDISRRR